jgi:uncharacterized protein YbjT (DUF2867 family)
VRTYAALGATGQTGSEIVKALLPTEAHLNIYARSLTRLESQFPSIQSAPNVTIFIGNLFNTELLTSCLPNSDVILSSVAQNRNKPGLSVAQRTALAIIQALESRRSNPENLPTVVFLSSGAVMPDKNAEQTIHSPSDSSIGVFIGCTPISRSRSNSSRQTHGYQ